MSIGVPSKVLSLRRGLLCLFAFPFILSGCANNGQNRYSYSEVGHATLAVFGTVVSTRTVDINGKNTGTGAAVGAAAGGIAGSQFGNGGGNAAATLAGVIIGAAAGAMAEQALADRTGLEYVIALTNGKVLTIVQEQNKGDRVFNPGERVIVQASGQYQRVLPADNIPTQMNRPVGIDFVDPPAARRRRLREDPMKFVIAVLALVGLSGCAFIDQSTPISYNAPPNLEVAQGAADITLQVSARDGRASNKDRVGSVKNGYGMETARIISENDLVSLVRGGVENELGSLGYKMGAGGFNVGVELQTFYNDFKTGFFSGDSVAEVAFNLSVTKPDGGYVYSRSYKGIGMKKNIMMAVASNARPALEEALTNAMEQLINDVSLQQALATAARAARTSEGPRLVPSM